MLTAWDGLMMIRCRLSAARLTPSFLGMLFSSTISCSDILWQREKKGNGTFVLLSAAMIADQTQPWLRNFHEILTNILRRPSECENGRSVSGEGDVVCC